jgi:CRISPR-associated endonuclease/helicase Cas3
MNYDEFFKTATGRETGPFHYQRTFATNPDWYDLVHVPTGAGKTAAAVLGWLWRRSAFVDEAIHKATPRRLVYCLPMRTLVEQTQKAAEAWLTNLGRSDSIGVHVLMGGETQRDWDLDPEKDAILIGTQDMLLSRALNRGYGMSRYRWPMHFALLNNDCLWVLDEIQLMGSGLSTTAQLEAFRRGFGAVKPVRSIWMSATLDREWLRTVDFKIDEPTLRGLMLEDEDKESTDFSPRYRAKKPIEKLPLTKGYDAEAIAKFALQRHRVGSLTLIVVNTVERAYEVFAKLEALITRKPHRKGAKSKDADDLSPSPSLTLLHSRFRPLERAKNLGDLLIPITGPGRIVVATQVIEAGVDISGTTLITELAPWASLVQRFGRCNRIGKEDDARVFWFDPLNASKKALSGPYESSDLDAARVVLESGALPDVGPNSIDDYLQGVSDDERKSLFSIRRLHVVRRKDLVDLFDTTPDLAGNDVDVSRFIRDGDDSDVQAYWRDFPPLSLPPSKSAPGRVELCPVPIGQFRDFLKKDKVAYCWDALDGEWRKIGKADVNAVFPGQVYLLSADGGGYDVRIGWLASSGRVEPLDSSKTGSQDANDSNRLSRDDRWLSIAEHTDDVVAKLRDILGSLDLDTSWIEQLNTAARWHDLGKAHSAFQALLHNEVIPDHLLGKVAKAPGSAWRKGRLPERPGRNELRRKRFRHELASALAMIQAGLPDLAAYLASAHHGKVRLSIRSLPDETRPADSDQLFARGIHDGDPLPAVDLGDGIHAEAVDLDLGLMALGRRDGRPSWAERMLRIRDDPSLGPFRLAFLEAILRAADMRASASILEHHEGEAND